MMFLGGPKPAVLQGAVTLSLDTATFSMSAGKMDTTGCWLTEASRVQKQTTPLKPQMVDALSHLHKNMNIQKKNPTSTSSYEISVLFIAKVNGLFAFPKLKCYQNSYYINYIVT